MRLRQSKGKFHFISINWTGLISEDVNTTQSIVFTNRPPPNVWAIPTCSRERFVGKVIFVTTPFHFIPKHVSF